MAANVFQADAQDEPLPPEGAALSTKCDAASSGALGLQQVIRVRKRRTLEESRPLLREITLREYLIRGHTEKVWSFTFFHSAGDTRISQGLYQLPKVKK